MAIELGSLCPLIQVFDMPTSLHFYRDILGFAVISDSGRGDNSGWVWLRLGPADLMLNTAYDVGERPPAPDPARVAAHEDTGFYLGCESVEAVHAHLQAHGVAVDPPTTAPYGMRQLYLRDPDGYALCFHHPTVAR